MRIKAAILIILFFFSLFAAGQPKQLIEKEKPPKRTTPYQPQTIAKNTIIRPTAQKKNVKAPQSTSATAQDLYIEQLRKADDDFVKDAYSSAAAIFLKFADKLDPEQMKRLGWIYDVGLGVAQDYGTFTRYKTPAQIKSKNQLKFSIKKHIEQPEISWYRLLANDAIPLENDASFKLGNTVLYLEVNVPLITTFEKLFKSNKSDTVFVSQTILNTNKK